jgi:flagellar hook-basal body complex protein FliE
MSDFRINELLSEMRSLAASAAAAPVETGQGDDSGGFAALLKSSVENVSESQMTAAGIAEAFERGDANVSLPEVMIALQKASLSFQAMTEVRNQLVSAYQEIMNMPV